MAAENISYKPEAENVNPELELESDEQIAKKLKETTIAMLNESADDEDSAEYLSLWRSISKDADLISDPTFLNKLNQIPANRRLEILARTAHHGYIGQKDFDSYFEQFPDDALLVFEAASNELDHFRNSAVINYELGSKVLFNAAKRIEIAGKSGIEILDDIIESRESPFCDISSGRLERYQSTSERSDLIRDLLLGDYKKDFGEKFQKFGPQIPEIAHGIIVSSVNDYTGIKSDSDPMLDVQDLIQREYGFKELEDQRKAELLKSLTVELHNHQLINEVQNSRYLGDPKEIGNSRRIVHSLIYNNDYDSTLYEQDQHLKPQLDQSKFINNINSCIKELAKTGNEEDVTFLLDFWRKNGDPVYGPQIAQTVTDLNVTTAAAEILDRLPKSNDQEQKQLLSLLFRLELGRIGISEEGLDYLGLRLDLGEYNSQDYSAHRLTPDGKIAVIDKNDTIAGYIQIDKSDFSDSGLTKIRKQIMEITSSLLFANQSEADEGEKQRQDTIVQEFKSKYFDTYLNLFSKESDLRFNNLGLPEQAWVLHYISESSEEQKERFFSFVSIFGEDGFRAFRSMEFGEEMAGHILAIAENNSPELAQKIFRKYGEIVASANNLSDFIETNLRESELTTQQEGSIKLGLLKKARDLIQQYSSQGIEQQTALKNLNELHAELLVFANAFSVLKEQEQAVELTDFAKINIETSSDGPLSSQDQAQMLGILQQNWQHKPDILSGISPDFAKALERPDHKFHIIKYDNDIVGFFMLDESNEGKYAAKFFNVNPNLRGNNLGRAILHQVFSQACQGKLVEATADPTIPIAEQYLAEFGFVSDDIMDNFLQSGLDFLHLSRDGLKASEYEHQGKNYQELSPSITPSYELEDPKIVIKFNLPANPQEMSTDLGYQYFITTARTILRNKDNSHVLTCYARNKNPDNDGRVEVICAFEKPAS